MIDLMNSFTQEIKNGPAWVYYWVNFMGLVFMLSIPFSFVRKEARWVLMCNLILAILIMMFMYQRFGYERILGLAHIIAWAPAYIYLWRGRKTWRVGDTIIGKWIALTFAVMTISLIFDVTDVVRYGIGTRGQ